MSIFFFIETRIIDNLRTIVMLYINLNTMSTRWINNDKQINLNVFFEPINIYLF